MAWLILLAAVACFAMAVLLPVGTGIVLLLLFAALLLLLLGTTRRLRDQSEAAGQSQSRMLDDAEIQRVREALDARRQASEQ